MSNFLRTVKRLFILILRAARVRASASKSSFLIPGYAGLGNFIMMTPMIVGLRRLHPNAKIYLLTSSSHGTDQIFERNGGVIDEVLFLELGTATWRKVLFFLKLRARRIAAAFLPFDASPSFVWWGLALAGIPELVGHTLETLGIDMAWTRSVLTQSTPFRKDTHEIDLHYDLLDLYEARPVERIDKPHVQELGPMVVARFDLSAGAYIVIQLSASNALPNPKMWPAPNFAELIRKLNADGEAVVLLGDINEKRLVDDFVKENGLINVVNLAGKTSIAEVSTIIRYAKLVICHDSGVMQIGNAHMTPLIGLIGATDATFYRPRAITSRLLWKGLPCSPCIRNLNKTMEQALRDCPINVQCMRDLSVEEVYRACKGLSSNDV